MAVAARERHAGFDVSTLRRDDVTDAVLPHVVEHDAVAFRPIAQDLRLDRGLGVFRRRHVVVDRNDALRIEEPVVVTALDLERTLRRRDLVRDHTIDEHERVVARQRLDDVRVPDLLKQ